MNNGESSMLMTRKFGRLERLCGKHFRRWQKDEEVVEDEIMEQTKRRCKVEE